MMCVCVCVCDREKPFQCSIFSIFWVCFHNFKLLVSIFASDLMNFIFLCQNTFSLHFLLMGITWERAAMMSSAANIPRHFSKFCFTDIFFAPLNSSDFKLMLGQVGINQNLQILVNAFRHLTANVKSFSCRCRSSMMLFVDFSN